MGKSGRKQTDKTWNAFNKVRIKAEQLQKKSEFWRIFFLLLWGIVIAVWVGLVLFAMQWLIAWIFVHTMPEEMLVKNSTQSLYQVVVYAVSLAVIIIVPWKTLKIKTSREELGLKGLPTWTDVLLAPIFFILTMLLALLLRGIVAAVLPEVDWEQAQDVGYNGMMGSNFWTFLGAFVCLVVLAPICEEVIFRGWLYAKLRTRMAAVLATILVSVLFGIMHGQWNVGITVFAMSIGMCVLRELTGTIWGSILLHMIKNGIAFYLLFVLGMG